MRIINKKVKLANSKSYLYTGANRKRWEVPKVAARQWQSGAKIPKAD